MTTAETEVDRSANKASPSRKESWWKKLGPGLITGAADDDPSGIATYSQGGAQFGYNLVWSIIVTYPLMVGIQLASARVGRVTGKGLAENFRLLCPMWLVGSLVGLLTIANVINLGADLNAMGDAATLVLGGDPVWYAAALGLCSLTALILVPYNRYVSVLKWLTLALIRVHQAGCGGTTPNRREGRLLSLCAGDYRHRALVHSRTWRLGSLCGRQCIRLA